MVGDGPAGTRYSVEQVTWLLAGHLKLVGRPLLAPITGESDVDLASRPYAAPFVALAHDVAADPCLTYADLAVQRLFERSWEAFVDLPSRLSAEAPARGSADPAPGNLREGLRSTRYRSADRRDPMHYTYAIAAWVGVCIASIPYSRRARHPQLPALTAWLTFTTVFSVLVIVTFLAVAMLADAAGLGDARNHPAAAVAYLSLLVGPALYFADLWIRRPPWRVPRT